MTMERFFGKYRGVVSDNMDPLVSGRIRATVPDVLGDKESGWALPCFPVSGNGMGFYGVPSKGAGVWVEFEQGDPDYPIWSGCWAGSMADIPSEVITALGKAIVLKTAGGNKIVLDDTPGIGGITLETSTGQKIKLGITAIEVDNGMGASIKMMGPQVSINGSALEIL
jgi:uncharacterized protein involved in type VI secretion and phage assembly